MDNGENDRADEFLKQHETLRNSDVGKYIKAQIEYISSVLLEEEGSDFDHATNLLKEAVKQNSFIAEFIAFQEIFADTFNPESVDEICTFFYLINLII